MPSAQGFPPLELHATYRRMSSRPADSRGVHRHYPAECKPDRLKLGRLEPDQTWLESRITFEMNKTGPPSPRAKKTAAKRQLRGQIHPQRQVLSEYPTQRGVHRMSG